MKKQSFRVGMVVWVIFTFFISLSAFGAGFSHIVSFGDSLSDNGSTILSGFLYDLGLDNHPTATDPYGIMHVTDGLVWVEYLAGAMGSGLYDAAFAGASSGAGNPIATTYGPLIQAIVDAYPNHPELAVIASQLPYTGLLSQVSLLTDSTNPQYDPFLLSLDMNTTLFTVWAGAVDFLYPIPGKTAADAAQNIGTALGMLAGAGAKHILVANLPDIASTPEYFYYLDQDSRDEASAWTAEFNAALQTILANALGLYPSLRLYPFDVYGLFQEFTPGSPAWEELFWNDGFHPSSIGHQIMAQRALDLFATESVPEPAIPFLMTLGLLGLAWTSGMGRGRACPISNLVLRWGGESKRKKGRS